MLLSVRPRTFTSAARFATRSPVSISNANRFAAPAVRSPFAMWNPASPKPTNPIAAPLMLLFCGFGAEAARFRVNHDEGHQCSQRMRAGFDQWMRFEGAQHVDTFVFQGLDYFRLGLTQTVIGCNAGRIRVQFTAQRLFVAKVVKQFVQFVRRRRRVLIELISA